MLSYQLSHWVRDLFPELIQGLGIDRLQITWSFSLKTVFPTCLSYVYRCLNLQICLFTMCMPGVQGDQKPMSDTLELELHLIVNHHVVTVNQPGSSAQAASAQTIELPGSLFLRMFLVLLFHL